MPHIASFPQGRARPIAGDGCSACPIPADAATLPPPMVGASQPWETDAINDLVGMVAPYPMCRGRLRRRFPGHVSVPIECIKKA